MNWNSEHLLFVQNGYVESAQKTFSKIEHKENYRTEQFVVRHSFSKICSKNYGAYGIILYNMACE